MLTTWLTETMPQLLRLADLPFQQLHHQAFMQSIGWRILREPGYPENYFEVRFSDVQRRLVAVYDESETAIGIGLYARTENQEGEQYRLASDAEFDLAFALVTRIVEARVGGSAVAGRYRCERHGRSYEYSYWMYSNAFLPVLQHFEGDGHFGHHASLDIRLIPRRGGTELRFPLATNLLF